MMWATHMRTEGISMRERYRLIGNAFHAGVMRHLLCCYISSVAMKGVVLRDDVRQLGVPFTMNQDGPKGGLGTCEELGQVSEVGMCDGLGLRPQPSQDTCPMDFFHDGGSVKTEKKEPARPMVAVRVKIEGNVLAKPKKGKGQKAAWRSMTEGCAEVCPTDMDGSLWDLVHDRWEKGKHPEMKVMSWDRQRKAQRPKMPTEAGCRLEFAKALADDYVVRSKEKVTWASYRG